MKARLTGVVVVLGLSGPVSAQVVDELSGGSETGRPMEDRIYLDTVQEAWDTSDPTANIMRVQYRPDRIYKLRLREMMSTTIRLPEGEEILSFDLGDDVNFEFQPLERDELKNVGRVRAVYPGADTNLSIIGASGRIYPFYLRVDSVKSEYMPDLVVHIEDSELAEETEETEPEEPENGVRPGVAAETATERDTELDYLRELPLVDPSELNFHYGVAAGDQDLAPIRVYDDGYWTYFEFGRETMDQVERLPVVYRVRDGSDSQVNTRVVGGTLIAETTSERWTLRNGEAYLCVREIE